MASHGSNFKMALAQKSREELFIASRGFAKRSFISDDALIYEIDVDVAVSLSRPLFGSSHNASLVR